MNRNSNNSRRPARGPRPSRVSMQSLRGREQKLRGLAPPNYSLRPWNTLTVNHVIASPNEEEFITNQDICNFIVSQLGLNAGDAETIVYKLRSVDAWATPTATSTDRPAISMDVSSAVGQIDDTTTAPIAIAYPILATCRDTGSLSEAAKVGYKYGLVEAEIVQSQLTKHTVVGVAGNTANVNVRFHILWCTVGESVPPAL